MKENELVNVTVAILLLFVVSGLEFVLSGDGYMVTQSLAVAFIVVLVSVFTKKWVAYLLDAGIEHRIWEVYHYGFGAKQHFKKEKPAGIVLPILFSVLSLGLLKVATLLTYETKALKYRAAKKYGFYSYTEMTDWHNGLIGAAGVIVLLAVSFISYFPGWELLSKIAAYYAFWSMVPISKLDGSQIFFGSKVLWLVLSIITLIFTGYAMVL